MDSVQHNNKKYSISYEETQMDFRNKKRLEKIIDLIRPCNKMVDLGCWDGFIMSKILESGKVKSGIGFDNSKAAVKMAAANGLDVQFIKTVELLPLKDRSVDFVLAGEIVEHVWDVNAFINEINRVLKKKGQLIISTPNLASIGSRLRLLFGRTPWMIENILEADSAGHIRYFAFGSLSKILRDRGFVIDSLATNAIQVGPINITNKKVLKFFNNIGSNIIISCTKK